MTGTLRGALPKITGSNYVKLKTRSMPELFGSTRSGGVSFGAAPDFPVTPRFDTQHHFLI
jgi:hypothetical protein